MGEFVDHIEDAPQHKIKVRQTWIGRLTLPMSDYETFRSTILEARRAIKVLVESKTGDEFTSVISYGPVKGANRTDVTRWLDKQGINIVALETEMTVVHDNE
jgi:hypothetical protein